MRRYVRQISSATAGFSLAEAAVALAIAGIILAAIWLAASSVWKNYGIYKVNEQVLDVATNIRKRYAATTTRVPGANSANITAAVAGLNLIPDEMRITVLGVNSFQHAMGGAFTVTKIDDDTFQFSLAGFNANDCTKFIAQFPIHRTGVAALQIGANGGNTGAITLGTVLTPAGAAGFCNQAGNGNTVVINFNLWN